VRQQDLDILKAIYDDRLTLGDYAAANGISYDDAEKALADALRRSKTGARWSGVAYRVPDEVAVPRQGSQFPGLARDEYAARVREVEVKLVAEFDDLDAWLYGEDE
jgi:hypothetical protein